MSKENQKIIPAYRFPKYNGEWIKKSLGQIGKPLMCKRIFKEQTTTDSNKNIPFFKIGTFGKEPDAYIPLDLFEEFKRKFSYPNVGDILISASGTIGRLVVYNGEDAYYQDSNIVWLGHDESEVLNSFLYYIYATLNWQTSDGGVIKRLYNSNIKEMEIFFPKEKKEQQKIADCLSSLDDLIGAENEKLDQLKDHKKGLLQQLFPAEGETVPKLRFPEFEHDGEWEEKRLADFEDLVSGDGDWILSKDISNDGEHKIVQLSSIGFGEFNEKTLKTISNNTFKDLKGTPILEGDLLINRMVDSNKINACIFPKEGNYITSVDVCWIRENVFFSNYFLMNLMCTHTSQKDLLSLSSGGGRVRISKKNLFEKFNFQLPKNYDEQIKIAKCLYSLDDSINAQAEKLEALKDHKKGLMQQLFPN